GEQGGRDAVDPARHHQRQAPEQVAGVLRLGRLVDGTLVLSPGLSQRPADTGQTARWMMVAHSLESVSALIDAGQIRAGMTRAALRRLLGQPDDVGGTSRKYKEPCIWKYGEVEFAFPLARSPRQAEFHGLWLVYVDSWEGAPRPFIKLLGPDSKETGS